ncbi:hypothetical protein [Streptomyces sp. CB09001]|uniref:hypothetical protein n=1 Tax=Streptomyces sp. CB09001 TaxID=2083284 RepID=UPI001F086170|nr:hypothetical protein [Streptomyces sp. CB09001]
MSDATIRARSETRDRLASVAEAEGMSLRAWLDRLAETVSAPAKRGEGAERTRQVLAELAALSPLLLVSDRWRPLRPGVPAPLAWTASGVLVLVALWQLVVTRTAESQTYLSSGTAEIVRAFTVARLFAIPALTTAVTWLCAKRRAVRR